MLNRQILTRAVSTECSQKICYKTRMKQTKFAATHQHSHLISSDSPHCTAQDCSVTSLLQKDWLSRPWHPQKTIHLAQFACCNATEREIVLRLGKGKKQVTWSPCVQCTLLIPHTHTACNTGVCKQVK
jgi:hypothetical protein